MKAEPHPRQNERLQALYSYEILDTDREQEFDEVAELAAQLCGVPVAVINLIDAERQWFKAEVGLGVRETPIGTSICSHVILSESFVEIEDTALDPRTADNPLCRGERGLRFYAGALLQTGDGLPIGTLCVLDHRPRVLTPLQRDAVRVLARQVMGRLELRRALRLADTLRQEVDHRVTNSLQLLSALIRLQVSSSEIPEVAEALSQTDRRIQIIAQLHQQLYLTDAGARIDLGEFLRKIAAGLSDVAPSGVAFDIALATVFVSSRQAATVGTLVNEIATNAFKHAFPDDRPGRVRLSLEQRADGLVLLEVGDDGIGLDQSPQALRTGLGMKIAAAVSRQLGSELDIDNSGPGVTFRARFAPQT